MTKPTTIDEYLRRLPADQRRALTALRAQIKSAAPNAEEYIGYGLAGFKVNGRPLIYMGAARNHCAIYGARADDALADKLRAWKQSKGTIQFTTDKPLPATLVKQLVKARLAALEQRVATKSKKPATAKTKSATSRTKNAATAKTKNAATSKTKNAATAKTKNAATAKTKNAATAKTKNAATAKTKRGAKVVKAQKTSTLRAAKKQRL